MNRAPHLSRLSVLVEQGERRFQERFPATEYPDAHWADRIWEIVPSSQRTRRWSVSFLSDEGKPDMPEVLHDVLRSFLMARDIQAGHMWLIVSMTIELWYVLLDHGIERESFSLDLIANHHLNSLEPRLVERGLKETTCYVYMQALSSLVSWAICEGLLTPTLQVRISSERRGRGAGKTHADRKARRDRLPHLSVIAALGELYRTVVDLRDRLRICAVTLQLIGGFRTDEVRNLGLEALQCEEGEDGRKRWYILYRNLKSEDGAAEEFGKRWLSPLAADLARAVWAEIRAITDPWRPYAAEVDGSDERISLDHAFAGREFLRATEVQRLLGVTSRQGWRLFRHRHGFDLREYVAHEVIPGVERRKGGQEVAFRRADLENWLVKLRGPTSTVSPTGEAQRVVDTLLIAPRQFLHFRSGALVFPEPFAPSTIYHFLAGNTNVFARYGVVDEAGAPYSVRPHALRHFLNTVANKAGLTALQITIWMGRTDHFQTYAYLHDPDEYAEYNREQLRRDKIVGARAERIKSLPVIQREAAIEDQRVAHLAGDVVCTLNFNVRDCPHHYACHAGCSWAVYDTTDPLLPERLKRKRDELNGGLSLLLDLPNQDSAVVQRQIADARNQIDHLESALSQIETEAVPA